MKSGIVFLKQILLLVYKQMSSSIHNCKEKDQVNPTCCLHGQVI